MSITEKISVTIGKAELVHAKRLASRLGVSLSGFITSAVREGIREQARREAALEVLGTFAPQDRASPAEARALLELWAGRVSPQVRRKAKRRLVTGRVRVR
ncbi:MAG TPA: hypothetical protein VJN18_30570 [Polyangiaceae bacterium]|nr:hypothetical protein [Polyangiaceae bacterium]